MILRELERIDTVSYLSRIRSANENEHQSRLIKVYEDIPEIREIDLKISEAALTEAKNRILGKAENSEDYQSTIDDLSEKKKELLKKAGLPTDYLNPIYNCPICKDWGEIDGKVCSCAKKLRITELYRRSNLNYLLERENFDSFRLDYYSKNAYKNKKKTPYENASNILNNAKRFVEDFDKKHDSILIFGSTGLGKTFLSNCIAKALLDKGHTVLYLSSNELFEEVLSKYIMSRNEDDKKILEPIYQYLYNSDLLIIDDLGTEVLSSFVKSQLFEIINKRILTGRSTLITSNLDLETLQDRYTERVMSRIADNYILYQLYGDDIRYIKKKYDGGK